MLKRYFKLYALAWALLFIIFNVISILGPGSSTSENTATSFWIGFAFINAAFAGQLFCAWLAFKDESAAKTFYNLSLFTIIHAGLVCNFVIGLICMLITPVLYWVGAIICPFIFIANLVAVFKAQVTVELVTDIDKKIETATAFIYEMREKSESMLARATTDEDKVICKKVHDAFKYCDPMSRIELSSIETEIKAHFALFTEAISKGNNDTITSESEKLLGLITERNSMCKRLK